MQIRKKRYLGIKALLLLILVTVITYFAGVASYKEQSGLTEKKVSVSEIKRELSFGVYEEKDWDTFFSTFHKEYLTNDMLVQLLEHLSILEYIDMPAGNGRRAVNRETWNQVYGQILDLLDMEQSVQTEKILVMDVMEAKEENVLITNQGDYYTSFPISYFEKWKGYEIYHINEKCLGVVDFTADELTVSNAYLKQMEEGEFSFLYEGASYQKEIGELGENVTAGVCDIVFSDGSVVALRMKQDLIAGELLSYDVNTIEIDGYGKLKHSGKIPVYQTYGEVTEKSISDIILGNMEVEYVTGENQVCAILIRQAANIQNIRVLLLAEDGTNFRQEVYLKCNTAALLKCGEWEERVEASNVIPASEFGAANPGSTLVLTPETEEGLITICDANGVDLSNGYAGTMEVRGQEEGYTLVNSLPFETYLYAVVPSEMPSSYAPEALKAQAVCARSYAYIQLLRADLAEYGAHINDSTSYQVYNKVPATEESKRAVQETVGQMLTYQGQTVEAYYFSTSMGYTDTAEIWNVEEISSYGYLKRACLNTTGQKVDLSAEEAFREYICTSETAYDSDVKYYRWSASADYRDKTDTINQILLNRHAISERNILFYQQGETKPMETVDGGSVAEFGELTKISALERSASGSILTLKLDYEKGYAKVKTEYNIRKVLGACVTKMVYNDSSESTAVTMLPSAFCAIIPLENGEIKLWGGGYGHGLGMSQNGANGMAKAGMNYEDILRYFYNDITLSTIQ